MKMIIKLAIACVVCIAGIVIIYIVGVLLYSLFTEFKPPQIEEITIENKGHQVVPFNQDISLLTWNIGYGGLGKEMDFFYEGGQQVRPDESFSKKYLKGIVDFLSKQDSLDLILLQEIDFDSKRSYSVDQSTLISNLFFNHNKINTINYSSKYVPVPYLNPMGKVKSGLATFSKYKPSKAIRMTTPGTYSFPTRLFMLKRCLLVTRYDIDNDKEFVLINLHNSAFADADDLRKEELKLLKQFMLEEYGKGNYVVAGGDWNQSPPDLDFKNIEKYKARSVWPIEKDFFPEGWNWAFDSRVPTNRDVHQPFNLNSTTTTILDYFVTSPNIDVLTTKTINMEFEFSDHQPVITTIRLN